MRLGSDPEALLVDQAGNFKAVCGLLDGHDKWNPLQVPDMEQGFTYIDNMGISPNVFVCLTDGYTDFTPENEPSYPVVWCISSDVKAPYGETIAFEMEQ